MVDPLDWAVDQVGPFTVGHQSISHTYDPGDGLDDRTIRIDVWYPTQDESGITAEYAVGTDAQVMENAAIATPVHDGGFPVHVHSHGYRGYGATSAFLARYFASHGWVTVAPGHTQNTIIDHVDPLPVAHFLHRPLDVTAALDSLTDIVPEADTSSVVLSGHSFGAYTTWASCGATYDLDSVAEMCGTGEGSRMTAARPPKRRGLVPSSPTRGWSPLSPWLNLARSWFGSDGELSVEGPVLFFKGTEDSVGGRISSIKWGPSTSPGSSRTEAVIDLRPRRMRWTPTSASTWCRRCPWPLLVTRCSRTSSRGRHRS